MAASSEVESWSGPLYFVCLPARERDALKKDDGCLSRGAVLEWVENPGIPVADVQEVFINTPDPLDLFPFRLDGHCTSGGYAPVAGATAGALREFLAQAQEHRRGLKVAPP